MLHPRYVIDNIADNVRKTGNPFGLGRSALTSWARGLDLPSRGDSLLFTGFMYQLVPYIKATTTVLARFEDSPRAELLRFGSLVPKMLASFALQRLASQQDRQAAVAVLSGMVRLLRASGVDFAYQPRLDDYSGVLLHDLGDEEGFIAQARRVTRRLNDAGIRRLITLDPHTTYALKELYPRASGISFEVHSYMELLNLPAAGVTEETVTLHDPCLFGRYLKISDAPRRLLGTLGLRCAEAATAGLFTTCCGGPAESLSPRLADELGRRRVAELEATAASIVTMCPICQLNLQRAGARTEDLALVLARQLD